MKPKSLEREGRKPLKPAPVAPPAPVPPLFRRLDWLALAIVDDSKRERVLQQATEIAISELGIIPLYHQHNVWATRKGVTYAARTDERTLAHEFKSQ